MASKLVPSFVSMTTSAAANSAFYQGCMEKTYIYSFCGVYNAHGTANCAHKGTKTVISARIDLNPVIDYIISTDEFMSVVRPIVEAFFRAGLGGAPGLVGDDEPVDFDFEDL